jgi:antitoxin component of RelBE/YafQ-DinJ toxin-antitoxin module
MQPKIKPILHESCMIHFPIFFEDGIHLFNNLNLRISDYLNRFLTPGIKIISIHPMDYVINTPEIKYMRKIKESLSQKEYNKMTSGEIHKYRYNGIGIRNLVEEIILLAKQHQIMPLSELYQLTIL